MAPRKKINIGDRHGRWTVVGEVAPGTHTKRRHVLCRCDCGTEKSVDIYSLTGGGTYSCGCHRSETTRKRNSYQRDGFAPVGYRHGRWTVISEHFPVERSDRVQYYVKCQCDCGTERTISVSDMKLGKKISCGCFRTDLYTTHGDAAPGRRHPLYGVWAGMLQRCGNPKSPNWHDYGGRGISVCPEWVDSYTAFRDWSLANVFHSSLEIDRIDNNGNYTPENCRWTTRQVNSNNTRFNRHLVAFGERKTVAEWSRDPRCAVRYDTLYTRIHKYGWDAERAIAMPPVV